MQHLGKVRFTLATQKELWRPPLWLPEKREETIRFLGKLFEDFFGESLKDGPQRMRGLERFEHLLRSGGDLMREQVELYASEGLIPIRGAAEMNDYLEQEIMEHIFRNTAIFSPPANVYVSLWTTTLTDAGTGTEVTGGSYAREAVSTGAGWDAPGASGGATANAGDTDFGTASAGWGAITDAMLGDTSSGGNMYFFSDMDASKTVVDGDSFKFATGDIDIVVA